MSVARNAPCPCGSGEKYKRCCGAPGAVAKATKGVVAEGSDKRAGPSANLRLGIGLTVVSGGVGTAVGVAMNSVSNGIAVGMALCMASLIYLMARKPPSSTGRGGGTAIDFGLNQRGQRRNVGPKNRRQRRQK